MKNTYTDARCKRLSRNTLDEGFFVLFFVGFDVVVVVVVVVFFQDKLSGCALRTAHCLVYLLQVETLNRYI